MMSKIPNSKIITAIFILLTIIGLIKPVGFDPDSRHYYDWISTGIYVDIGVEPFFLWTSNIFSAVVGMENAYYYINAFYIIAILFISSLTARLVKAPAYLWIFFIFCYASLVLTQIRFGLCLVSMVHGYLLFDRGRKFRGFTYFIFGLLNHFFGVFILILMSFSFMLRYYKINIKSPLFFIFLIISILWARDIIVGIIDILTLYTSDTATNKLVDNMNNTDNESNLVKSSSLFIYLSLLYIYIRFRSNKLFYHFNFAFLLGIASLATDFNHVLHIRLFQLYVSILFVVGFSQFKLKFLKNYNSIFIFIIYPVLYFLNDIFRNNFFGI